MGERLREMADDPGGSGAGVDFLDRVALFPGRGLAAESVDPAAERRDGDVAGRLRQSRDLREAAAIRRREHRVERCFAVVAAEHVGAPADRHRAQVGAHRGQSPHFAGVPSGHRQGLHLVAARFAAAAEDQHAVAERGRGGVVKRRRQRAGSMHSAPRVEPEDPADRGFGRVEPAEDQWPARQPHHRLARDRRRQLLGDAGAQDGFGSAVRLLRCAAIRARATATAAEYDHGEDDDRQQGDQRQQPPPAAPSAHRPPIPPPGSVGRRVVHGRKDRGTGLKGPK